MKSRSALRLSLALGFVACTGTLSSAVRERPLAFQRAKGGTAPRLLSPVCPRQNCGGSPLSTRMSFGGGSFASPARQSQATADTQNAELSRALRGIDRWMRGFFRLQTRADGFTWFGYVPGKEIGDVILTVVDGVSDQGTVHLDAESIHLRALDNPRDLRGASNQSREPRPGPRPVGRNRQHRRIDRLRESAD